MQFLARQLGDSRILVIGTYRDMELSRRHSLFETLAQLSRAPFFQRVLLRSLEYEDTGQFIETMSGIRPSRSLTETIQSNTEGNPFFMRDVVRLLVDQGKLTAEDVGGPRGVKMPEGVREVMGQRLNRLLERCNDALAIASVIGREFSLDVLGRLIDPSASSGQALSEDALLEILEEALSAEVIEEIPDAMGRYRFAHALIHDTLAEELLLTRRVRLHARIAETLEEVYGDTAAANAADLAHHFGQAEAVLGSDRLVRYSLLAGEQALAAYVWEDALAHLERALAAKGDQAADAETAAIWYGLGRAQAASRAGHHVVQPVVDNLIRGFDHYVEEQTRDGGRRGSRGFMRR